MRGLAIRVEKTFDAAHRLPSHEGKCSSLHGHTYRVEVTFAAIVVKGLPEDPGMVLDFGEAKALVEKAIAPWDHATILDERDDLGTLLEAAGQRVRRMDGEPTAERMAVSLLEHLRGLCEGRAGLAVLVEEVRLWETPSSSAVIR